jgi:hypothetical protein
MHGLEELDLLQQYGDVCAQQSHFVDEHAGMTHDVLCQYAEKRNLASGTHPPIGLYAKDLFPKLALDPGLEHIKLLKHIRFATQKIKLSKFAEVIYKTHIITIFTYRSRC